MRRKVIKQGNSSLTLTLPSTWVKQHNLEGGENINVAFSGDYLMLGVPRKHKRRQISLSVRHQSSSVKKLLGSLYRTGYDDINITIESPEVEKHLYDLVLRQLTGFEIIKKSENEFFVTDIADLDPKSFDVLLKKCFLVLLSFSKEIVLHSRNKDLVGLKEVVQHDIEVNKLTDLCQRLLNKKMNDRKKIVILSSILKGMEFIGDELEDLVTSFTEREKVLPTKVIANVETISRHLQQIYLLYYSQFDLEKCLDLVEELRQLKKEDSTMIARKMILLLEGSIVLRIEEDGIKEEDWVR